jgi:hypothetical protein
MSAFGSALTSLATGQRRAGEEGLVVVANVFVDLGLLAGVPPVSAIALGP